jgi:hypothetical protein
VLEDYRVRIESDIPIPQVAGAGCKGKYPWKSMLPGQSIFVAHPEAEKARISASVRKVRRSDFDYTYSFRCA